MDIIVSVDKFDNIEHPERVGNFAVTTVREDTSDLVRTLANEQLGEFQSGNFDFRRLGFATYHTMLRPSIHESMIEGIQPDENGIVEYGEYPQSIDAEVGMVLEPQYHQKQLEETGKSYHLSFAGDTKAKEYKEYELDGQRYIRVVPRVDVESQIKARKPVWVKVEPIKWRKMKDWEGRYEAVSKLCVPPSKIRTTENDASIWPDFFGDADRFLNKDFAEDIKPQTEVYKPKQKNKQNQPADFEVVVDTTPMSVAEQIDFYVRNHDSFMLHGPAGIGKSARVEEIDPDLTALPLWNGVLPEDIVGKVRYPDSLPASDDEREAAGGIWTPPDWYVVLCRKCKAEPEKTHVLFIDEVTNARPTTQSLIFNIALRKSITANSGQLPENSVVILAGNSQEESNAAYNMPEPLFRRMCGHIYLEPSVPDWLEWGSKKSTKYPNDPNRLNIHPIVSSFVATFGDKCFYTPYDEENPTLVMDPRGWAQVSDIIYDNKGRIRRELLESKMGRELAASFLAFAVHPPLSVQKIVNGEYTGASIPQKPDEKLAVVYGLRYVDERNLKTVRKFVYQHLGAECCATFDSVWIGQDAERAAYVRQVDAKMRKEIAAESGQRAGMSSKKSDSHNIGNGGNNGRN